ncbi:isochorismatase family protein [Exilibacterium tricleocarpae]|uniref:Isochorismatase family protein n=1 Tax=Exilibacterium tricleocarpae TaxID=2591008 RepID=A0A545TNK7_9GAMM|nr:isochorismatase family protein [Exilibacterium tricleocarpae]TQV78768.1 isochorismatase family protein [Exilibacterium tricleocarpae]
MDILLIIDMQVASFAKGEKYDSDNVIARINQLSEHVRRNGGKVVFIQHDGTEEEGLLPFSSGWKILPSLTQDKRDVVIRKTINDSFYNTSLNKWLQQFNEIRLLVTGWATDFCVDTTIRAAVSHGYNVVAVSDCHTVSDRPHLSAEQVIEHHNWIWNNMHTPAKPVEVLPLKALFG